MSEQVPFGEGYEIVGKMDLRPRHPAEAKLRRMLALAHDRQGSLYGDDGELQDNGAWPMIDYQRDSVDAIEAKLSQRGLVRMVECGYAKPSGWKLVPVEPTTAMLMAGKLDDSVKDRYQAQLAAAPEFTFEFPPVGNNLKEKP